MDLGGDPGDAYDPQDEDGSVHHINIMTDHPGSLQHVLAVEELRESVMEHRPFRCKFPGCLKTYRHKSGLDYHNKHGHILTGPGVCVVTFPASQILDVSPSLSLPFLFGIVKRNHSSFGCLDMLYRWILAICSSMRRFHVLIQAVTKFTSKSQACVTTCYTGMRHRNLSSRPSLTQSYPTHTYDALIIEICHLYPT
jgi:hypothetical protein